MKDELRLAIDILVALKCGSCWCGMGIGDPHYTNHTVVCIMAAKFVEKHQP